jgi:hypothetical protein
LVTLAVAACGGSAPGRSVEAVDLSRFSDSTVVGGQSEFLVAGLFDSGGGVALFKVLIDGDGVTVTPEQELRTVPLAEEVDAYPTPDQSWAVLVTGCLVGLDGGGQCPDYGTLLVTVAADGSATEVGRVDTAGASAHVVGDGGDGRVVVRLGRSSAGSGSEVAAEPVPISYEQTYVLLDLNSAEITPLDALRQSLVAPSVVADPSRAADAPFLSSCASSKDVAVMKADDSAGTNLSLLVMDPLSGAGPTTSPVDLPDQWLPKDLLCDGPGGHRLVLVGPTGESLAVADVTAEGEISDLLEAPLQGLRIQGLQTGLSSVLVDAASSTEPPDADGSGRRLFAFTGGGWQEITAPRLARNKVVVADDGTALLIREDTELRAVVL